MEFAELSYGSSRNSSATLREHGEVEVTFEASRWSGFGVWQAAPPAKGKGAVTEEPKEELSKEEKAHRYVETALALGLHRCRTVELRRDPVSPQPHGFAHSVAGLQSRTAPSACYGSSCGFLTLC